MTLVERTTEKPQLVERDDESDVYPDDRRWVVDCVQRIRGDLAPVATELTEIPLPPRLNGLRLYVKREADQPSGSHKHRLAAALLVHALVSGWLTRGRPVVEASSGSTAISEAWYCQRLGIPFYAVVPDNTSREKKAAIAELGGTVVPVSGDIVAYARRVANRYGGHFLDQFSYAERAYDWRGDEGLGPELLRAVPDLDWFVMGAGTGGTATSVARHARYTGSELRVCVPDPEHSAYFDGWYWRDPTITDRGSHIEGIGRPRVEASFVPSTVNRMIRVHDAASVATMRVLHERREWGISPGPSTGTGVFAAIRVLLGMRDQEQSGSVATVLCDAASRYTNEYYNDQWLADQGIDYQPWLPTIRNFFATGDWTPPEPFLPVPRPLVTLWNM
ncbi:PLP-dependent cysteine synthase family protein [Streptomyces millisiae]|uniref:Pyridoxal-phosphate dependent enzyme n=1 Tax=Streptomyces millisiae TaxID=3075542 RepID=A0ABU2LMF3_9ACTN|nr:pyridoxal-phosphate dependent enzyme [Streptomyces sp. DSM 44918]MDT0318775.1 pyridoxal-phosphate dependent enzyme [Streptomyces sp. DSM 44918]